MRPQRRRAAERGAPEHSPARVRRAAALVFCASLAAPLLGAGGSAEAQNTPDTTPPTLTSADVEETNGLSIYLEFSDDLQLSNPPPASAFTLTVDGSAVTGFSVAWQGSLLPQNAIWLVLPTAIRQGQVVVVTYEDPTAGDDANAIQDTAGNAAATFTTGMDGVPAVTNNSTVTNTPATGAPTITGTAQVGQTLTAGTTAIMDDDGLTSVSYTYQWIRTAAGVDTNISGATASTYTLVAADQGTTVKVRVSFTDDASKAETRTSAATAAVAAEVTGTPEPEPEPVPALPLLGQLLLALGLAGAGAMRLVRSARRPQESPGGSPDAADGMDISARPPGTARRCRRTSRPPRSPWRGRGRCWTRSATRGAWCPIIRRCAGIAPHRAHIPTGSRTPAR